VTRVNAGTLIVFGSGGHAKVVVEAIRACAPDRDIVLLDDRADSASRQIFGISVSGGREQLDRLKGCPIALGIGDNQSRSDLMAWLAERGHALETVIHPRAFVAASVKTGEGAFIGAGAIAIADAKIGAGAIVNTGASVDHDCEIGKAAHIAPGVRLCGNVRIGDRTLIGVGSVVRPGVTICSDVVVGAGATVVGDIAAAGTFVGNPARRLR